LTNTLSPALRTKAAPASSSRDELEDPFSQQKTLFSPCWSVPRLAQDVCLVLYPSFLTRSSCPPGYFTQRFRSDPRDRIDDCVPESYRPSQSLPIRKQLNLSCAPSGRVSDPCLERAAQPVDGRASNLGYDSLIIPSAAGSFARPTALLCGITENSHTRANLLFLRVGGSSPTCSLAAGCVRLKKDGYAELMLTIWTLYRE
jgi:hypothetical protein